MFLHLGWKIGFEPATSGDITRKFLFFFSSLSNEHDHYSQLKWRHLDRKIAKELLPYTTFFSLHFSVLGRSQY
jgi:hypothetical protein